MEGFIHLMTKKGKGGGAAVGHISMKPKRYVVNQILHA